MSAPQPSAIKLPLSPSGSRIRKPVDYIRHYNPENRALLESGDLLLVEPRADFGFYLVRNNSMPELLPEKSINIATRWTTPIPKLTSTASPSPVDALIRALDVGRMELAHYRLACLDSGFQCQIAQPTAAYRFTDKVGARRISYGNSMFHLMRRDFGALAEIFVFQDNTPIQIVATSTNMNEDSYWARIVALGYKYHLTRVRPPDPDNEPRVVMTIRIGEKQ